MATFARPQTRPSPHEPGLSCHFEASFLGEDPSDVAVYPPSIYRAAPAELAIGTKIEYIELQRLTSC